VDEKPKEKLTWAELKVRQREIYDAWMADYEEQEKKTNWPVVSRVRRDEKGEEVILSTWAGKMDSQGYRYYLDGTPLLDKDGKQIQEPGYAIAAASLSAAREDGELWELAGRYATGWTPEPPLELAPAEENHEYTSWIYGRIGPERIKQKYTVACSHCPAGIWHINREGGIRIFCTLMRSVLVLNQPQFGERMTYLKECDGKMEALEAWREANQSQDQEAR
jgi:hypothetical protein